MRLPLFLFEWDETKAAKNAKKHGVPFELARTIFNDPRVLTVPDIDHSENDERWFSVGSAANGVILSVAHLWNDIEPGRVTVRLISARRATRREIRYYQGSI